MNLGKRIKNFLCNNKSENVPQSLRELKEHDFDLDNKEVRRGVAEHFEKDYKYVSRQVSRIKSEEQILKTRFEVNDGLFTIFASKGQITLTQDVVDELFYTFSKHGLNETSTQIINRNGFKPWEWHAIKNALGIYKHSNVYSDYTLENKTPEEKKQIISEKIEESLVDKLNVEKIYNETVIKGYKQSLKEKNLKELYFQSLENSLLDIKDTFQYKEITIANNPNATDREIVVFLADLHAGAKVKDLYVTPDYSFKILEEKLANAAEQINKMNAEKVNIVFLGDIIESFTGLNHKNTWQELEEGMFGAKLVKNVVELILDFISQVSNVKQIYAIGGNHDRGDSDNKVDYKGEIAGIIFNWLETLLPMPVEFNYAITSPLIDGIQYICMHGHNKEINAPITQTILNYGTQGFYNLLVSGHLHTFKVTADAYNYRQIICPSVFTGNTYSERNAWTSNSGFMIAYNNGDNKPNINIYSI